MRAQTEDPQLTGDEHFCDRLLVSTPLEVGAGMDGILPGPTSRSEQGIEAIRIGSGISIWNNLSPEFSGFCSARHPPFDHRGIKGYLEFRYQLFYLIERELWISRGAHDGGRHHGSRHQLLWTIECRAVRTAVCSGHWDAPCL